MGSQNLLTTTVYNNKKIKKIHFSIVLGIQMNFFLRKNVSSSDEETISSEDSILNISITWRGHTHSPDGQKSLNFKKIIIK